MCAPLFALVPLLACSVKGRRIVVIAAAGDASVQDDSVDDEAEIPCDVRRVLENICQQCHTRPAKNGAPFPLESRSDVLDTYGGEVIRDLAIEQVTARRMPLTPVTIREVDRDVLLAWLRAGAPAASADGCVPDDEAAMDAAAFADARAATLDASLDGDARARGDAGPDADGGLQP